jgi:tyrosyl-tRNA synthetase
MELRRRYGCLLQMGGSDQWGNIVTGIDLTRRVDEQSVYGLTSPLITTASGAKMGKSGQGAIWLNEDHLSVWDFWQFWRNTEDNDVGQFLRLFTELPLDEIARLEALEGQDINDAKIILANEVTALCHSPEQAKEAEATANQAFNEGKLAAGLPQFSATLPLGLIDALKLCGFAASKGEARRLIRGGGGRVNDISITDEDHKITTTDTNSDGEIKISAGKKRHAILQTAS